MSVLRRVGLLSAGAWVAGTVATIMVAVWFTRERAITIGADGPGPSEEHRIGAAMGLFELGGDERKSRLRIAADACASERMRIALGKLADGDVDERALEEALAEADTSPAVAKSYM